MNELKENVMKFLLTATDFNVLDSISSFLFPGKLLYLLN